MGLSLTSSTQRQIKCRDHYSNRGSIDSEKLRKICATEAGLTLGLAVGGLEADAFRIGHMGHLNPPMILGTLATIEAALLSMNASIGRNGIGAAAEIIAKAFPN